MMATAGSRERFEEVVSKLERVRDSGRYLFRAQIRQARAGPTWSDLPKAKRHMINLIIIRKNALFRNAVKLGQKRYEQLEAGTPRRELSKKLDGRLPPLPSFPSLERQSQRQAPQPPVLPRYPVPANANRSQRPARISP